MSKLSGHLLIPPFYASATAASTKWLHIMPTQDAAERGIILSLFKSGLSNVITFDNFWMVGTTGHKLRPGFWAPFAPDDSSGASTVTSGNIQYKSVTSGYLSWVLPSGVPTMDKLSIYFSDSSSNIDVIRIRGGTPTTIASNVAPGSSYQVAVTVSLSSTIQAGDTVKFIRNAAGECNICTWAAYDSTGLPDGTNTHWRIPEAWYLDINFPPGNGENDALGGGSSMECAYRIAPTGSAVQWIGGTTHNDGTSNCAEVNVTESWTKDGSPWTPVPGYHIGAIVLTRTSDVRYTDGSTILGTLVSTYTFRGYDVEVTTLFTASRSLDTGALYIGMLDQTRTNIHDDTGNSYLSSVGNTLPSATRMIYVEPMAGSGAFMHVVYGGTMDAVFNNDTGKCYFRHPTSNQSGLASNATWGGTFRVFADVSTGKTKPTLACAVGSDGLTVTVTVSSLAPTTPGTTGVTIKRGGSSLTVDSKTNNGDGTITYVLNSASKVYSGETITYDFAAGDITDTYIVSPAAVTGGSVTNNSAQSSGPPDVSYADSPVTVAADSSIGNIDPTLDSGGAATSYAITTGSKPSWLSFNTSTGRFTGTPASSDRGSFTLGVTATNGSGAGAETDVDFTVTDPPVIDYANSPLTKDIRQSVDETPTNGAAIATTYAYQSGTVLSTYGLTLDASTGRIHGTLSAVGSLSTVIRATNADGTDDATFAITVSNIAPNVTYPSPVVAYLNHAFSIDPDLSAGGTVPASGAYAVQSGSLPTGLSLNADTGAISGTATVEEEQTAVIRITNAIGYYDASVTIRTSPPLVATGEGITSRPFTRGTPSSDGPTSQFSVGGSG